MIIFYLLSSLAIGLATSALLCRFLSYAAEKKKIIYSVSIALNTIIGIVFYFVGLKVNVTDTLYSGCYVTSATYYEPWDEKVKRTREVRVGTDSNGNPKYKNKTYYEHEHHPETFKYKLNNGSSEVVCTKAEFDSIISRLSVGPEFVDMHRKYYSLDGNAYRYEWDGKNAHCYTVTESKQFTNYLKGSDNSIFKYHVDEEMKQKYGLFDYPKFSLENDQVTVLGYDCSKEDIRVVQFINGYYGEPKQFRLYVLFYDTPGVMAGEMQKSYWQGGKPNEFVVCLGHEGDSITWCYPFSWSDSPKLEEMTKMYFMEHPRIDIIKYALYVIENLDSWQPKNFEDFSYLSNSLKLAPSIRFMLVIVFFNLIVGLILVRNDRKKTRMDATLNPRIRKSRFARSRS